MANIAEGGVFTGLHRYYSKRSVARRLLVPTQGTVLRRHDTSVHRDQAHNDRALYWSGDAYLEHHFVQARPFPCLPCV